jgi:3-oxoacyl-ACP reductase-like protein
LREERILRVFENRVMRTIFGRKWDEVTVERRGVYRLLVGNSEGKRSLGRPRRRWKDNIRMDLQEGGCVGMDWIGLVQDRDR